MKNQRIIMAGGGDATKSIPLDAIFARWTSNRRMLYLPIAMEGTSHIYDQCEKWIHSVFEPLGVYTIEMHTELTRPLMESLAQFESIYIGGGNTFRLLDYIRRSGFDRALTQFIDAGGAVYGGSAGAIVLGKDIATCGHLDKNMIGILDTKGLNCVNDFSVWCHYKEQDGPLLQDYARHHQEPIIAIPEESGVVFEGFSVTAVGTQPIQIVQATQIKIYPPGFLIENLSGHSCL